MNTKLQDTGRDLPGGGLGIGNHNMAIAMKEPRCSDLDQHHWPGMPDGAPGP